MTQSIPSTNQAARPDGRRFPPVPEGRRFRQLVRDPLGYFSAITAAYGDVVCYRPAPDTAYLINHPDHVRHVLVDNNRNYSKETHTNQQFNKVVAEGLLTTEGDVWRKQRRMMQPAFHRTRLELLDTMIAASTGEMLERWQDRQRIGQPVDIASEMAGLTLAVTTRALFGVSLGDEVHEIGRLVNSAIAFLEKPSDPSVRQAMDRLDEVVQRIIDERRREFQDGGDLLSSMMLSRDQSTGEAMNDEQLRNQIMTLMLAGYETTASALTWTWRLLAEAPAAVERLQAETRAVLGGRPPQYADLERLPFTGQVLNEAMRLFPPAWILGRRALGEDEIGGYYVAPGTTIAICLYTLHRHPEFWERPDEFDPDRFSPERAASRHKFAFIPFGAGPRQCIGNTFGLMEASLVIAHISQHYSLRLAPGVVPTPQPVFVLRSGRDLKMTLHAWLPKMPA